MYFRNEIVLFLFEFKFYISDKSAVMVWYRMNGKPKPKLMITQFNDDLYMMTPWHETPSTLLTLC